MAELKVVRPSEEAIFWLLCVAIHVHKIRRELGFLFLYFRLVLSIVKLTTFPEINIYDPRTELWAPLQLLARCHQS